MKNRKTAKCDDCGKEGKIRNMRRRKDGIYCHKCSLKNSKCIMPNLSGKIPKSYMPPKKKEVVKKKRVWKKKSVKPKIKGSKKVIKSKRVHQFITKDEKYLIYLKCVKKLGMSGSEARKRIEKLCEDMRELAIKLRRKIKDEQELDKKFKAEFARMCEELGR